MRFATFLFPFVLAAAEIPQGAHLLLRLENTINTRTAQAGDAVYLRTASPIAGGGQIIVPTGSYVQGVVLQAKRSGRVTGRAQLAIRLETLTLPSGQVVKFAPHLRSVDTDEAGQKVTGPENTAEQAPTKGRDVERIAILAGTGAALGGGIGRATECSFRPARATGVVGRTSWSARVPPDPLCHNS